MRWNLFRTKNRAGEKLMRGFLIFIGVLVIIVGWASAAYVGIWLMLICGIIQLIEGAKMDPVSSFDVAVGIARILLCGLAALIGWFGTLIGSCICGLGAASKYKSRTLADARASMKARARCCRTRARRP